MGGAGEDSVLQPAGAPRCHEAWPGEPPVAGLLRGDGDILDYLFEVDGILLYYYNFKGPL